MASFLDKIRVKTAVDSRQKFDLGCDHITTSNWFQFSPVFNKELVPKEKIDVKMETFTRMLPLNYPTFGRANIHNTAFFVPYRTVFPGWNDFITDSVHINSSGNGSTSAIVAKVPVVENDDICTVVFDGTIFSSEVSAGSEDYTVRTASSGGVDTVKNFKLSNLGRQAMKILQSLGYNLKPDFVNTEEYSALPLLSVVKIYIDWYYPSAYANESIYQSLVALTKMDSSSSSVKLGVTDIRNILSAILFVCYDSDYFTSCWDNPVTPNDNNASPISIPGQELFRYRSGSSTTGTAVAGVRSYGSSSSPGNASPYYSMSVDSSVSGSAKTPYIDATNRSAQSVINPITQYILDSLHKLTDYMKRHQLVGAKAIDRYLARFGVQLTDDKMDRSMQVGRQMVALQIGDVMSNADTSGASLGDYAGKGLAYGDGHFDFETDEYGQFVIISSIIPAIGYYQGVDRNVKHISKLDFWTPEFDALGTQAVGADELYITTNYSSGLSDNAQQIFGWLPRYAEYKTAKDKITGDYRYDSMNTGEDAWYLMRTFSDSSFANVAAMVHSPSFMKATDWGQYNRIFNGGTADADPFRMIYHFEIGDYAPMKALYDNYHFEENGKEVVEDVNGVKVN